MLTALSPEEAALHDVYVETEFKLSKYVKSDLPSRTVTGGSAEDPRVESSLRIIRVQVQLWLGRTRFPNAGTVQHPPGGWLGLEQVPAFVLSSCDNKACVLPRAPTHPPESPRQFLLLEMSLHFHGGHFICLF